MKLEVDKVLSENDEEEACLRLGLPKWPAMWVRGTQVSVERAKEIIRRTDSSFVRGVVYGNDKAHVDWVSKKLGMPRSKIDDPNSGLTTQAFFNAVEDWRFAWGALELEYIGNDWVSSMYVYGPNGWCRPDGTISHFKNVGKWPSVEDLVRDWIRVAEVFPFLDLLVTFFDREYCEENFVSVFTLRVFEGGVTARVGSPEDGDPTVEPETFNRSSECGLPMSWFEDWAQTHVPRK